MTFTRARQLHPDDVGQGFERIVVIAASAGGLNAVRRILEGLPATFAAPVLVVLHRTVGRKGLLADILARRSALPVVDAEEGQQLQPGVVYVAPADRHLHVVPDAYVTLHDQERINFLRASADPLFESTAAAFGARAIAVVLTGMGKNGAAGAKKIRDAGGDVIAQDEATSEYFGMPRAAIEAGAVTI